MLRQNNFFIISLIILNFILTIKWANAHQYQAAEQDDNSIYDSKQLRYAPQQPQGYSKWNNNNNNNNNNQNYMNSHSSQWQQPPNRDNQQLPNPPPIQQPNPLNIAKINRPWGPKANKCKMWIPTDVADKYPLHSVIQEDASKGIKYIEACCDDYVPMRYRSSTHCRPVCENCRNGHCVAPNVCECFEDFARNDNGDCVFTCPLGCLNGQCYLDGTCECDPGYKLDKTRRFCQPICSNGCNDQQWHNCTEPEVCSCRQGYQLMDGMCAPTCTPECGPGGTCIGYNECECAPSFKLRDGVCQADCYQKCTNGFCYKPNRCICKPNFTYHEKSTMCVPI